MLMTMMMKTTTMMMFVYDVMDERGEVYGGSVASIALGLLADIWSDYTGVCVVV